MGRHLVLVLLLGSMALTGCWDRVEVNDLAIVTLVGIDKAEEGLRLSVGVVVPRQAQPRGEGGGARNAVAIYSGEGETILDAMTKVQKKISRHLLWSHTRVLIIGADYARAGVRPALDFWSRHPEPRLRVSIAITPGQALEFLQAQPVLELLQSEAVREIINFRVQSLVTIKDFLTALRSPGEHPVAPRFEVVAGLDGGPEREVGATGTAVFRKDRLIGWLDDAETRGLLWLRDEVETGAVTVTVPGGGKVSTDVIRAKTQVRPEFSDGRLRLVVSITTEDELHESSAVVDFAKEEMALVIDQLLEKELRQSITAVLDKVQHELRVDIFHFGDAVRQGAPVLWEDRLKERWDQEFPGVPVDLRIKTHVRRTGEHGAPLGASTKQLKERQKGLLRGKE